MLECADLRFDPATRRGHRRGCPVTLTAIETSLVRAHVASLTNVLTRLVIATQVWEDEAEAVGSNTIDVHVGRVRSKLASSRATSKTVRGTGYRMVEVVRPTRAHRREGRDPGGRVATVIVMVGYVIAATVLNLIVTNHLVGTTDARLADRLQDTSQQAQTLPDSSTPEEKPDLDDVPLFLWSIAPSGVVTPLTPTAPRCPRTGGPPAP